MRRVLRGAALCLLLTVTGCIGSLRNDASAPLNYRISAPRLAQGSPLEADVLVTVETTAPGLEGTGIAGRFPGSRIDYLAGARWPVPTATLVESALIEALQNSGRLRSVRGDLGRFRSTHAIALEIRRFDADFTGGEPPVAHVALAVTIGRETDRRVLAAFSVAAREKAAANRVSAVVAALDAAFARAAGELVGRSFDAIAADLRARPESAALP